MVEDLKDVVVAGQGVVDDSEDADERVQQEADTREQQVLAEKEGEDGGGGHQETGERVVERVGHHVICSV